MNEKPVFIEDELWVKVTAQRNWDLEQNSYYKKVHFAVHFKVCSIIANFHQYKGTDRYRVLELVDRITATSLLPPKLVRQINEQMPDIYDVKLNKLFDVKVVREITPAKIEEITNSLPMITIPLIFSLTGNCDMNTKTFLDKGQIQDVQNFLINVYNTLLETHTLEDYYLLISGEERRKVNFGSKKLVKLALQHSDLDLIPLIPQVNLENLKLPPGDRWELMDRLPKFEVETGENPYNAMLIGHEGNPLFLNTGTDQEVLMSAFSDNLQFQLLRGNSSFGLSEIRSLFASIQNFKSGIYRRIKIDEDMKGYGIKKKIEKRNLPLLGEWIRPQFDLEKRGCPEWVKTELRGLRHMSDVEWLELPELPEYNEIDRHSNLISTRFLDLITHMGVVGQIEKWVTAATKIDQNIHEDREKISLLPIITRKKQVRKEVAQLWGVIGLGPHHPKMDSDKIPLLILEFVTEDYPSKYKKWSFVSIKDLENKKEFFGLGRVYSVSKYKVFYWTGLRKLLLQPLNTFSKVILEISSLEETLKDTANPIIRIPHKQGYKGYTLDDWVRRILCIEFLMAIYNDSQMEGYLSNIRRLHMARHAMITGRKVFKVPHGKPEEKVQECVVNNPIVAHLAKSWNDLPANYGDMF